PINPFHTRELDADELTELLTTAGFDIEGVYGVFHREHLQEIDARHGGSIIAAQIARALAAAPWPDDLLAAVAALPTARFDLIEAGGRNTEDGPDLFAIAVRRCPSRPPSAPTRRAPSPYPGCSPSSCTRICRGWPITAGGRSARSGSTSRGRRPICR